MKSNPTSHEAMYGKLMGTHSQNPIQIFPPWRGGVEL